MILFAFILVCEKQFLPDTRNIFFFRRNNLSLEKKLVDKQRVWGATEGFDYIVFEQFYLLTGWDSTYFKFECGTIPALNFSNPINSNNSSNVNCLRRYYYLLPYDFDLQFFSIIYDICIASGINYTGGPQIKICFSGSIYHL